VMLSRMTKMNFQNDEGLVVGSNEKKVKFG
jgi:hypothetical protein